MHFSASTVLAVAVAMAALGAFTAPVLAQHETGADIPKDSYYQDPLTGNEKGAIAEEEDVTPNDGQASVPPPPDQGVIPDAQDPSKGATGSPAAPKKSVETEAEVILNDAKKEDPVTANEFSKCMSQWDPQSQMTKEEWANSCRTTLQYFPEEHN